ncbi:MAG: BolA family transcriptional regulator [Zetaproteobacteria bacterium]|nr:BolA family transcriptional regulator [Zetaproteobacteria bacterium]
MSHISVASLETALQQALAPTALHIEDESWRHAGHAGASPTGGSHFFVRISSPLFQSHSRIQQHRLVNQALAGFFVQGLHALRLETSASQ